MHGSRGGSRIATMTGSTDSQWRKQNCDSDRFVLYRNQSSSNQSDVAVFKSWVLMLQISDRKTGPASTSLEPTKPDFVRVLVSFHHVSVITKRKGMIAAQLYKELLGTLETAEMKVSTWLKGACMKWLIIIPVFLTFDSDPPDPRVCCDIIGWQGDCTDHHVKSLMSEFE